MTRPHINVTPLIDVLLVLLIIFMVVAPIKPSSFKARVPAEPQPQPIGETHPDTLVVTVARDGAIALNREQGLGTASDTSAIVTRLKEVFRERLQEGSVSTSFADDPQRPFSDRVERTVFIKAPRHLDYGSVARVVDAVKVAGAYPISLQIDHLDE